MQVREGVRMKRRIARLGVLLLIGVNLALLLAVARYRLLGLLRNESFYKGRPTSYWSSVLQEGRWESENEDRPQGGQPILRLPEWIRGPAEEDGILVVDLGKPNPNISRFAADPAAVPVLIELLQDDDET